MAILLLLLVTWTTLLGTAQSTCFCNGLCSNLKPGCRYGEEIRHLVADQTKCYSHCADTFILAVQQAACFKGCLSDGCTAPETSVQKWSTTIKDFFTFKSVGRSKQTSETVVIVDSTKDSLVYSLFLNGKPVYSKDMSLKAKNGQIVSYTFMSWTMLDRKSELIMTGLGLLCFVFGVILLISPCFEDGDRGEKDTCSSVKVQKSEKQNIDGLTVDEMRKSLLQDYQLL